MAEYLNAIMGPQHRLPLIGDDDGGRLFFPCVSPEHYGRATLETCGQLLGRPEWARDPKDAQRQEKRVRDAEEIRPFSDSGSVVWSRGEFWVLIQAGGFGALRAAHSHSHALSLIARLGDEDLLIGPGTFTHTSRQLGEGGESGWCSRAYGQKESAPAILAALRADTPVFLGAALVATGDAEGVELAMVTEMGQVGFNLTGRLRREIWFNLIHA
jgi:hypothetical protein